MEDASARQGIDPPGAKWSKAFLFDLPAIWNYAIAVAGVIMAALIRAALNGILAEHAPLLIFAVPVVAASLIGGAGPGLLATALAIIFGEYFFVLSRIPISEVGAAEWLRIAMFLFVGASISFLGGGMRSQGRLTMDAANRLREQAERLTQSEEQHRTFFELAGVGMIHVDPTNARIALANRRFCEVIGYSAEELSRLTLADITHPDDWERDQPRAQRLFRGEIPTYETEKRYIRKDGRMAWAKVSASVIRDSDGRIRWAAGVIEDVTEKKRAECEMRETAARLHAVVSTAVDGIVTIDERGTVESVNEAAVRIFGYEPDEVIGQNVRMLMPEPYQSQHDMYLSRYLDTGDRKIIGIGREVEGRRKDGATFPLDLAVSESVLEDRRFFTGTVRDITERKKAESQLRELTENLEQRVRERTAQLEDVNLQLESFAYTVSHDLRAPLRAVQGFAQALLEDHAEQLDSDGLNYAQRMIAAAAKMDQLIQDLLAYSRLQRREIPLTPVSVTDSINTVLEQLQTEIMATGAQISTAHARCCVHGNGPLLGQVLTNLVSNALKFIPEGTTPNVHIRVEPLEETARIWVEDHGIGVAAEHHGRIFNVFERLHGAESYPGTGIGLAIVRKAMERMGGQVGIESTPGRGSRFWIELKRAATAVESHGTRELLHSAG